MRSWANFHRCNFPRQTVNFFYSTAIQIKDYIPSTVIARLNLSLFAFLPVTPSRNRCFALAGADRLAAGGKKRDNGIRLQFAFIKATEGEKRWTPIFRVTGN